MSSVRFKRTSFNSPVIAEIHCQPWDYDREGNPASLRRSIHEQAEKQGYRTTEFNWYEPGMSRARLMNIVRARGIRAVLFEHFMEREVSLEGLDLRGLAMVSIGGAMLTPRLHRVEVNHYSNLIKAVKTLQPRGYRRFGVIIPSIFERASDFKRTAALYSDDLQIEKRDQIPVFFHDERESLKGMGRWLKTYRPDCVLGVGKELPEQLHELGYSFPDDIGFAHLGWHSSYGTLAGMNPRWNEAGKVAVSLIIDQLTRNEHGIPPVPLWILIEGEWKEGSSVRPPQSVPAGSAA
jgi:DNA-binding LacI/PurR family transcriptional regulator